MVEKLSVVCLNPGSEKFYVNSNMTLEIDILNPKAKKLLKDLEDLELISIRKQSKDGFMGVVKRIRAKAAKYPITLEEITQEVEEVRSHFFSFG
jgi:hypothetical protein